MTSPRMYNAQDNDRVTALCAEIEVAWIEAGDSTRVEVLAEAHPELSDELYAFFEMLLDAELAPEAETERPDASAARIRSWLEEEGYEAAHAASERERASLPLRTPTLEAGAAGAAGAPSEARSVPLVGLLREHTRQRLDDIAQRMRMNKDFLSRVSERPDIIPLAARREVARRAEEAVRVGQDLAMAAMNRVPLYARAASRDRPYQNVAVTYEKVVEESGMTEEECAYWLRFARVDDT